MWRIKEVRTVLHHSPMVLYLCLLWYLPVTSSTYHAGEEEEVREVWRERQARQRRGEEGEVIVLLLWFSDLILASCSGRWNLLCLRLNAPAPAYRDCYARQTQTDSALNVSVARVL